eukprot:UN34321
MSRSSKTKISRSFRLTVLGSSGVGKTSMIQRFHHLAQNKQYNIEEQHVPTIEDQIQTDIEVNGQMARIEILDTAGLEDFKILLQSWISDADGLIFVYAINDKQSLINLEKLIISVKDLSISKELLEK